MNISPYTDAMLISLVRKQIDYYKHFGDQHEETADEEKIWEIYYEQAVKRVVETLELKEDEYDKMYIRIQNLF